METPDEMKKNTRKDLQSDDTISKLKRRMYSRERKGFLPWRKRRGTPVESPLATDDWTVTIDESKKQKSQDLWTAQSSNKNKSVGLRLMLVFSLAFFVITGYIAVTMLNSTGSAQLKPAVDVTIEGVSTIANGGVLEMQVLVANHNSVALETVEIVATYPDGTVSPVDFSSSLAGERITLGKVDAQSARRGTLRAVVLGRSGDRKDVQVELQYRVSGGNAIYSAYTNHSVLLSDDAMSVSIQADDESTPGQAIPIVVSVVSHSNTVLHGAYLDVAYPFGFTMKSSTPQPTKDIVANNKVHNSKSRRWLLGTMRPGEERRVRIVGALAGQSGDERTLAFTTGSGVTAKSDAGHTVLAQAEHKLGVRKSFLSVELFADGKPISEYVARAGEPVSIDVVWHNNLLVPVNDATIAITLGGSALNKAGVKAVRGGFYRSVDSVLLWDSKTSKEVLQSIPPGKSGKFTFKLTPLPKNFLQKIRTPKLSFVVHAAGKRLSEHGVPEVLKESSHTEVKVGTNAELVTYGLFHSSLFGEVGPLPPKVEYETTYGIVWEVSNTTNDLNDVIVRAELPHYVRWVGLTNPASEQLVYDATNKTIEWNLGTVPAGSGVLGRAPRKVSFAVGLVPSATQIGQTPNLVMNQTFEATDAYTGELIEKRVKAVDTKTEKDTGYNGIESRVVK